jgi:hypothetical protein
MGTALKVVGSLAILRTEAGPDRYLYNGALVGDGFTKESVEHAISVGLVAAVEVDGVEDGEASGSTSQAEEAPSKSWNHDRIDAWAGEQDPPIVFTPNTDGKDLTKEQKLEQIAAAVADRSNQQ